MLAIDNIAMYYHAVQYLSVTTILAIPDVTPVYFSPIIFGKWRHLTVRVNNHLVNLIVLLSRNPKLSQENLLMRMRTSMICGETSIRDLHALIDEHVQVFISAFKA
jgi:hypothetical protein